MRDRIHQRSKRRHRHREQQDGEQQLTDYQPAMALFFGVDVGRHYWYSTQLSTQVFFSVTRAPALVFAFATSHELY